jgi:hypothetical protein
MSSLSVVRLAGAALALSAGLTVTGYVIHPAPDVSGFTTAAWLVSHLLLWLGAVAGVAGIAGLSFRQTKATARLGFIGGALATTSLVTLSGAYFAEALIVPAFTSQAPEVMATFPSQATWGAYRAAVAGSGVVLGFGFLLLGIAMYRAALLPRWAIALSTVGAIGAGVVFLLPRPVGMLAFAALGVGLVGLGYSLLGQHAEAESDVRIGPRDRAAG